MIKARAKTSEAALAEKACQSDKHSSLSWLINNHDKMGHKEMLVNDKHSSNLTLKLKKLDYV